MSRVSNDSKNITSGLSAFFGKILQDPLTVIGMLGLAMLINFKLALLGFILFPMTVLLVYKINRRIKEGSRKAMKTKASIFRRMQETIFGIKVVKAWSSEDYEKKRYRKESRRLFKTEMRVARAENALSPIMEVMGMFIISLFLLLGGKEVVSGKMSSGDFMAFYAALGSLYAPLKRLSKSYNDLTKGVVASERVFELMDMTPEIHQAPHAIQLASIQEGIRFDHVGFSYDGKRKVLKDIDLMVPKGEVIAIVGFSGAGKTTLVNLIPRFYEVTEGSINIDGTDIKEATLTSLRGQIGLVSQEVILFNDTVWTNIAYGRKKYTESQIIEAAKKANAHPFIEQLPKGYDTYIGERGLKLSGGQCQRIAIARAILKDPPILILDEATSSLDAESEALIQQALEAFVEGRTTFIVAHRFSTIKRAHRIVVLHEGRVEAMGSHEELMAKCAIYKNLYRHQFEYAGAGT